MANTVASIVANAEAAIASVLGVTWKKLRRVYELDLNDERDAAKGYAVRAGAAVPSEFGMVGYETLDQTFTYILSDTIARGDSDDEIQDVLDVLYEKSDQIFVRFVQQKLSLSAVLKVDERSMEEPIVSGNAVYLRVGFVVTYRQSIL